MAPPSFNVKIRGNKRPRIIRPEDPQVQRQRGRPKLSAEEKLARREKPSHVGASNLRQRQCTSSVQRPQRAALSRLESLPTELVQQVFFYCLETNLIAASPHLTRALSQERIYRSLILLAFFDDDEEHPVEEEHFLPAQYRVLCLAEKHRLQQNILKCHWCTLDRLQACLPILARLRMVQEWHVEKQAGIPYGVGDPLTEIVSDRKAVAILPDLDQQDQLERHFFVSLNEFDIGDNTTTINPHFPRLVTWAFTMGGEGKVRKALSLSTSILGTRHIPRRLLVGNPWTPAKLDFLQLLRQGNRFLRFDFLLQFDPSDLFAGMASAIRENNHQVLLTLLELHHATFRMNRFTVDNFRPERQLYNTPSSHPLPIKLFHVTSRRHKHASKILAMLLREGLDCVSGDDAELTKWALRARTDGDRLAKWLLKHMEGTQDYGLGGWDSPLFINGELNPRRKDGHYPFPDRSFTAELGYITHGATAFSPRNEL